MAPGDTWALGQESDDPDRWVNTTSKTALPVAPGDSVDSDTLRPPASGGDFAVIQVRHQLNSGLDHLRFGMRLWRELLCAKLPALDAKLNGPVALSSVVYNDRYVRSPLMARLVFEALRYLKELPGGVAPETQVRLTTPHQAPTNRAPTRWSDNWDLYAKQEQALTTLLERLGCAVVVKLEPLRTVPHGRELVLTWRDGTSWLLRLDQGFGFLDTQNPPPFDFRGDAEAQGLAIADKRGLRVGARDPATSTPQNY